MDETAPSVGIREVAERAGVATSTVSRAIRDHPDVSAEMRAHVLATAAELGYEPNLLARSFRRGATHSIGFVLRDISSPVLSRIALGAEIALHAHGYSTILTNSEGLPSREAEHVSLFRRRRVDGLLLSLADETHEPTLAELRRLSIPFVLLDRELPDGVPYSAVWCDEAGGIRTAVEHVAGLGHRRIGYVGGPLALRSGRESERSLAEASAELGVHVTVERCTLSDEQSAAAVGRLLAAPEPPTAIVVGSILFLAGALGALRDRGLRVPDDVSLVGFDDVPFLDFLDPPISTVSRRPLEVGRQAAELLVRLLRGGGEERVVVPTSFHARASTAPPRRSRPGRSAHSKE